ncbi:MAG: hypothetical protein HZB56_17695 [Deltaproteobacteria bacterium]|nr:hypothetical protein [Deltaproteobacteria bacterium]
MSRRGEAGTAGRAFLAWVAILLLAGLAVWLLSERNARQYFLVAEEGQLLVKRGMLAPYGRQSFKTDDPQLLAAYAFIRPPPGAQLPPEQTFDDRAALDQALYELLARWAREDVAGEKAENLERASGYVARAERLAGISGAQREDLRALRAESGFFEARLLLEKGADALRQARERLRLTAQSASPRAGDAAEALKSVEPALEQLHQTSRLLAPAAPRQLDPPPAAPAPAPAR